MPDQPSQSSATKSLAFVMELQAGMGTQYKNWRRVVEADPTISATWVPISWHRENGWIERMRFLPASIRAALRGNRQVEEGLGNRHYDAVLFNTHNAAIVHPRSLTRQNAWLMFDVTPSQYDAMAVWYEHTPDKAGWLADYKFKRVKAAFQQAAGLFAWSQWAAQSAIEDYGADPKRVHILPPGVDAQLWTPLEAEQKPNDGITRILFIGYAFQRKGGDLLLRWAVETTRRNWELHVVTMEPMASPPGVVVHTNLGSNAAELIELARRCDIFALPTRADCYSIASLEAMAVGLPVITTRVGGIPDIVTDGKTGYLLEPDDYEGLRDRLEMLLDAPDLRESMGRAGREVVCARYQLDALVKRGLAIMLNAPPDTIGDTA